jgi:crotonobetainyl-CoA:carnitine CoA-transferase CaiB-like acyl-CoA transferase
VAHALGATVPAQQGNVDPPSPLSGCYACLGDDEWITVSVQDRAAWQALCDLVGARDLADAPGPFSAPLPPPQRERLDGALGAWAGGRSPASCLSELQARGIAAGAVLDVRDLLLDPHLENRGFFWSVDHHPLQRAGRRAWPGASASVAALRLWAAMLPLSVSLHRQRYQASATEAQLWPDMTVCGFIVSTRRLCW